MRKTLKRSHPVSVLFVLLALSVPLAAQTDGQDASEKTPPGQNLTVGSPAPELDVSNWIKGKPIHRFETGHVYVIDCWATWCGPCIRAIPHMSEIQKQYAEKNVHVIGVSLWENTPSGVPEFVAKQGDQMKYSVAMDQVPAFPPDVEEGTREASRHASNGAMAKNWMEAAKQNGIPTVFIVDQESRIAWIGHPMGGMDEALAQIVDGSFDIESAAAEHRKKLEIRAINQTFMELLRGEDHEAAIALARENVQLLWWDDANMLNRVAWTIVDPAGKVENKDLDLAMKAAARANELAEHSNAAILDTLARVWFLKDQPLKALELQKESIEAAPAGEMKQQLEEVLREYEKAVKRKEYF